MSIEKPVKTRKKTLKTILWTLLGIIAGLTLAGLLFSIFIAHKWKPFVTEKLQEAVTKGSDSLYRIKFSGLELNLFSGDVKVTDFEIFPDSGIYNKLVTQKKAPNNLYHLKVKELNITDLAYVKAYLQKKLIIDSIQIDQPDLTIFNKRRAYNDTVKQQKPETFYQLSKNIFKEVKVDGIALKNINFVYINKNGKTPKTMVLRRLNIRMNDLLVDSLSAQDSSRFYSSKSVEFQINDYQHATPDSLYFLKVKNLYFSTDKKKLLIENLALSPRLDKTAFYQKIKVRNDRYDLTFGTIAIDHLDLQKFEDQHKIYSSSAHISNANVAIFSNPAYPKDGSEKPKRDNFPQQQLQRLAADVKIDTLFLKNINVSYAEANANSKKTGTVTFDHTSGTVLNITNDSAAKKRNSLMTVKLNSKFLNTSDLDVNFQFHLLDKKGAYNYHAKLAAINGETVSKLTVPLALLRIKSADIERVEFNVSADNYKANGQMKIRYQNLQVEVLKRKEGEKKLQGKGLVSTLANTFVIDSENPENGNFRVGLIQYERPADVSFFSMIWNSLLSGIKSSVGVGDTKNDKSRSKVGKVIHKVGSFLGISKSKSKKENR